MATENEAKKDKRKHKGEESEEIVSEPGRVLSLSEIFTVYLWSCAPTVTLFSLGLLMVLLGKLSVWVAGSWMGIVVMIVAGLFPVAMGHFKPYLLPFLLYARQVWGYQVLNETDQNFWLLTTDTEIKPSDPADVALQVWRVKMSISTCLIGLYIVASQSVPVPIFDREAYESLIVWLDKYAVTIGFVILAIGLFKSLRDLRRGAKL